MDRPVRTVSASVNGEAASLSLLLREHTKEIHARAERTGVVRDLLRGTVSRDAYALLLRNLLPAYQCLEEWLERRRSERVIKAFVRRELYRSPAIVADLDALSGCAWRTQPDLLDAGRDYAARIELAGREPTGGALMAHAYVRYFGDLSGGQILKRLLARSLNLPETALSIYTFADIADPQAFKTELREAIDCAGRSLGDLSHVIDEAVQAFRLNIAVSEAIHARIARASASLG